MKGPDTIRKLRFYIETAPLLQALAKHGYIDPALLQGDVQVVRIDEPSFSSADSISIVIEGDSLPEQFIVRGQVEGVLVELPRDG